MLNLGAWQLGQEIPVTCQVTDGVSPAWPDAAPILALFSGATLLRKVAMPADSQAGMPGVFRLPVFLDGTFSAGPIAGYVQWVHGGVAFSQTVYFRILPGGDVNGSIIAATFVQRPSVSYIVFQSDAGEVLRGSNPRSLR